MNKRYELTDEQENIIRKAIEILDKNFDLSSSHYIHYFEINDNSLSDEYDVCDNDKCVKKMRKNLNKIKKTGAFEKGVIKNVYSSNDGDHEDIRCCAICGKPLNEFLTWIKYEFEYFQQIEKSKKVIEEDFFRLFAIFQSVPSCDYQRTPNYENEKELFKDVAEWADFVVSMYSA